MDRLYEGKPRPLIRFDGDGGDLFGIFFVNLILTILTLGIYRFWAKTRIRRYLWAHALIENDRCEYTGTGKELFIGFIIVVVVILIPLSLILTVLQLALATYLPAYAEAGQFIYIVVFAFLIQVAIYRALRYRMSRTQWRGIRGALTGSAIKYAGRSFAYSMFSLLTLWLAYPFISTWLMRYKVNNSWFGSQRLAFHGTGGPLFRAFLPFWIAMMIGYGIVGYSGYQAFQNLPEDFWDEMAEELEQEDAETGAEPVPDTADPADDAVDEYIEDGEIENDDAGDAEQPAEDFENPFDQPELQIFIGVMLLAIGVMMALRIFWFWYKAAEYRYFAAQSQFGGYQLSADVTGGSLLWLAFSNRLLLIFTLGFGRPWVWARVARFLTSRLQVVGEMDLDAMVQSGERRPGTGEGLVEALDLGDF